MDRNIIEANTVYLNALERAQAAGYTVILVVGDDAAFIVENAAGKQHLITAEGNALTCDETCEAAQHGKYCMHRACVTNFLMNRDALAKLTAMQAEMDAQIQRGAAKADAMIAVLEALKFLAGVCDGARARDGQGFNGTDTRFGHDLALCQHLSNRQMTYAAKMLQKYRKQVEREGLTLPTRADVEALFGAPTETTQNDDRAAWVPAPSKVTGPSIYRS